MFQTTETGFPIALYTPNLQGGGAEWCVLTLAGKLVERGYRVDLLLEQRKGAYANRVPEGVTVHELPKTGRWRGVFTIAANARGDRALIVGHLLQSLKAWRKARVFPALLNYVRHQSPAAIICSMSYTPVWSLWAARAVGHETRVINRVENTLSAQVADDNLPWLKRRRRIRERRLQARIYPKLDAIVTVSNGVGDDLSCDLGLNRQTITTIYNPVVSERIDALQAETPIHHWFAPNESPVILAVGSLSAQKDFSTLIAAFANVRQTLNSRLIIVGEGEKRNELEDQIASLNLDLSVDLPGWTDNPFAFMKRSSLFVLCSRYEGLGNALIEAMACGCPVVSTDCPNGPREILADGQFGELTEMGNVDALAGAIIRTMRNPLEQETLVSRASQFSVDSSTMSHEKLFAESR